MKNKKMTVLYSIPSFTQKLKVLSLLGFISLLYGLLSGCSPSTYSVQQRTVYDPPLSSEIFFYPEYGQSKSQQERDRYECYLWAVKKSGFDPNQAQLAPHQRVEVKPSPPPGAGAVVGAASGALLGSIASHRRRSHEGLVFGAITGAIVGAATDVARQQEANRIQQQYDDKDAYRYAQLDKQARDYRRAMSACLEGRRYSVQ